MHIDIFNNAHSTRAKQCTSALFWEAVNTPSTKRTIEDIREKLAQGDKEAAAKLKRSLPAVSWQGHSLNGRRGNDFTEPSGLYMLDIDHIAPKADDATDSPAFKEGTRVAQLAQGDNPWGIVLVHITPSGQGLRVVARFTQPFPTLIEHQRWLAAELGLGAVDEACKDLARLSFLPQPADILYIDEHLFTDEATLQPLAKAAANADTEAAHANAHAATPQSRTFGADIVEATYNGRRISDIAQRYLEVNGRPDEGERHTYYVTMANHFRYISDNKAGVILCNLPDLGLSIQERESIVNHAVKLQYRSMIPHAFYKFLESECIIRTRNNSGLMDNDIPDATPDKLLLPSLPPLIREYVAAAPKDFKKPTIFALMPILGTLTTRYRAHYLDGMEQSTSFHNVIVAPASSGKSFAKRLYKELTVHLKKRDEKADEREQQWIEEQQMSKNSEQQPRNPHVCKRLINPLISPSQLLERQSSAHGMHQLTFCPEVDTLAKSNKGERQGKSDMYRIAWDNDEYGQDYVTNTTFKGTVRLYYNLLLTGTPKAVGTFYSDTENGLVSRVSFCNIHNQLFNDLPVWKEFTPKQQACIDRILDMLDKSQYDVKRNGDEAPAPLIDITERLEFFRKPLQQWLRERKEESRESFDIAMDTFRRRSAVKAWRVAMVCVALYGGKVTTRSQEVITKFALWYAENDLQELCRMYGNKMDESVLAANAPSISYARNIYSLLPDTFSRQELQDALNKCSMKTPVSHIVYTWKKDGLIEKVEKATYRKATRRTRN